MRCLSETRCAAVMSAEALLEKPDLFVEDEENAAQQQWMINGDALVRSMGKNTHSVLHSLLYILYNILICMVYYW